MKLLFLGDIVGSCGRRAVVDAVPALRRELALDFVVANGENVAGGRGITESTAEQLFDSGVDVITGGNHTFQHRDAYEFLDRESRILRPLNYPEGVPGHGIVHLDGLTVINVMGRTFMGGDFGDPFRAVDEALTSIDPAQIVLIDFHAEATSEKQALGWYADGRATAVIGTHTHVPTADCRLLPRGTAFCTDAGMCGARDSIIGDDVDSVLRRFLTQLPTRLPAADGDATLNGVLVEAGGDGRAATAISRCDRTAP